MIVPVPPARVVHVLGGVAEPHGGRVKDLGPFGRPSRDLVRLDRVRREREVRAVLLHARDRDHDDVLLLQVALDVWRSEIRDVVRT